MELKVKLATRVPPSPHATWNEEAVKAFLQAAGFDVTKKVTQTVEGNVTLFKGVKAK